MKCTNCSYHENSGENQLFPRGSINPDYYILGEQATVEEYANGGNVFAGTDSAVYISNILGSLGLNESNTRFFKAIRCPMSTKIKRTPENINQCGIYAMMDIFKTRPKIIVSLGLEVTKYLLGDRFKKMSAHRGRLYDVTINGETFKVIPTHSPDYILYKMNMELGSQLLDDLKFAIKYVNGELTDMGAKNLECAKTFEEFQKFYNDNLDGHWTPSFDLETNAREARSTSARMVGFSLAPNGSTGVYVLRESLEYRMPDDDWNKIVELTKEYLSKSKCKVHNSMYEVPFTYNEWNYLIENFDDTLVKARLMLGGKIGAGLKEQCITQLGYPDWDKDIGDYLWGVSTIIKNLRPTKRSKRWDYEVLEELGLEGLWLEYSGKELDKRCTTACEGVKSVRRVVSKYYEGSEYDMIMKLLSEELVRLIDIGYSGVPSYGIVPSKVIAAYGAMDAVATQDLDEFLSNRMSEESQTLGIDLFKGYKYWLGHHTVAAFMEMSGIYWNDEIAQDAQKWYSDKCIESMKNMLNSGFLDDYLFENHKYLLTDYVKDNLDEAIAVLGMFTPMKSCIKLQDGTKITWKNLVYELDKRTNGQWSLSHKEEIFKLIEEQTKDIEYYTDYKWVFNPNSPNNKELLSNILVTSDIRIAHFLNQVNMTMDNPEFKIDRIPYPDRKLFQIVQESRNYNKSLEDEEFEFDESSMKFFDEVDEEEGGELKKVKITSKDTIKKFKEVLQDMQFRSKEVAKMLGDSYRFKMEDTTEPTLIEINSYYEILGIDVEDESTWTDSYKFLYNFRTWKKCNKMVTSYITGNKVGRGQVAVVDKESLQRGDILTRRKRMYNDGPIDKEKECYVMQSKFAVCSAETGRWKTGMHTIPTGASIKNIYTSRFENGIMFMPDYSAMEVRVIAGASNCEPMLKTFREGGDIHTENAARVWDKPAEEITKEERRYSKMATFALLYGSDYRSFGANFLDGDIPRAKKIFDNFFSAFPQILDWVETKHEQMRKYGKVTTMTNRFINVSPELFKGDEGKALRAAQNYPIQGSGSDMAGYVLYKIHEYIREHNMKSKVVLFIHDSLEIDVHPDEILELGKLIIPLMNMFPMQEFGMVTSCDLALGVSLGQEIEVKKWEVSDDNKIGDIVIEGYDDCIQPLLETFRKIYKVCDVVDLKEPEPVYVPKRNLFIPKLTISEFLGKNRMERKISLHVEK